MQNRIDVEFLQEEKTGSHQGDQVAKRFSDLVGSAKKSVHIAVYHFLFKDPALKVSVVAALHAAARKGIDVKIAYYDEKSHQGTNVRAYGAVSNPVGTAAFLEDVAKGTPIALKSIEGSHLLHDKFVVVDAHTIHAKAWTGSTNFTDGAWKFMENNILTVSNEAICAVFENVFQQLWEKGNILHTGGETPQPVAVGASKVTAQFSPVEGRTIEATIADAIQNGKKRVKVASMVLSSETILQALVAASKKRGLRFGGIYDEPETTSALRNSRTTAPELFGEIKALLVGKHSMHYDPQAPSADYNYMHNKILVSDDTVVTGSFNFSKNATQNAENILVIEDKTLADHYAEYIDQISARYKPG